MSIFEKLSSVQQELKAPKDQFNSFGKYKYRSAESILEAVKPILAKHGLTLILSDDIELKGERVYVKATAWLIDTEDHEDLKVMAFAREAAQKSGMDDSQITGTASSYARKYALNALFLIDDTKDADTDEYVKQTVEKKPAENVLAKDIRELAAQALVKEEQILEQTGLKKLEDIDRETYAKVKTSLLAKARVMGKLHGIEGPAN